MNIISNTHKLLTILVLTLVMIINTSCIQQEDDSGLGTSGGNPGNISIESAPYTNDGTAAFFMNPTFRKLQSLFLVPPAYAGVVTDFKFCITKLKVVSTADGAASGSQEAILGLVDISDQNVSNSWGNISLEEGSSVSEIHFEVHYDSENCSAVTYSTSYNGQTITKDLEFKFKFDPAITANNGDTLSLGIGKIAKAMEDAHAAGKFNNTDIGAYMEATVIGTGEEL